MADVNWAHGSLITPATPDEPPGLDDGSAAALLDEAEDILNEVGARDPCRVRGRAVTQARRSAGGAGSVAPADHA